MDENPDNYSDVDWSDGAEESNDEADRDITKSGGNDETLHLNIGTSTREEHNEKKRKRDTVVYTDRYMDSDIPSLLEIYDTKNLPQSFFGR